MAPKEDIFLNYGHLFRRIQPAIPWRLLHIMIFKNRIGDGKEYDYVLGCASFLAKQHFGCSNRATVGGVKSSYDDAGHQGKCSIIPVFGRVR